VLDLDFFGWRSVSSESAFVIDKEGIVIYAGSCIEWFQNIAGTSIYLKTCLKKKLGLTIVMEMKN